MPKGSDHQLCTNRGQSSDPLDDYKPRAALEDTHFFERKSTSPQNLTYFWGLSQLAKRLCPFKLYRNSVQRGMVDARSYFTNAQTHHDEASQMTDPSPDLTTCDTERRSLAHPPLARAPRDEMTACDQVLDSHNRLFRITKCLQLAAAFLKTML